MSTPQPVDLNKLKSILGNAKKIMKASDEKFPDKKLSQNLSENYSQSRYTTDFYNENDEKDFDFGGEELINENQLQQRDYTVDDVINSNLPPIVKEAMIKKPIPRITGLPSKVNLEDLGDLVEKPRRPQQRPQQRLINEQSYSTGMINISIDELNELIDKRVNEVVAKMFVKTLTEQTIKKTVSTLMNEGKVINKKK
jgi:hypothetical protein